ncbi:MAG: cardiolipin synthase [Acidobacteria bacterium]|nr:cardiolipin synthase [Candidatus Sulfomarinibacter sp. MAG AM1]
MIVSIIIVFHVLGFISSIHAVMSTRTSQGAVAWVVSLNTFPYFAVPAYWVLGRSGFRGYVTARQTGDFDIQYIARTAAAESADLRSTGVRTGATRAAELLAEMPALRGNTVELLIDGDATFASIFEGIEAAQDYVLVQFFIVKDDGLGRELKTRLIAKAREGIRVFFLYDEVGSYKLPGRYIEELREAGVEAFDFHSRKGPRNHFQINFRNHRKIVVADGHTAWIGGHNVGDEYLGKGPLGAWRDTHIKIEGPAAMAAQLSFFEDWHWAADSIPEFDWTPRHVDDDGVDVLIIPTGPADELETAGLMFVHAINSAQERIWIASPYFVPDEAVMAALQLAGLRGVDVRILIPDEPDHLLVYLAAYSYFSEAGSTGVKFYRYTEGFLHEKVMLIDQNTAAVGTANFDNRSFRLNFEITAFVADGDFAAEVEQMFLDDFATSREMQSSDFADRSFWFKLAVSLARLTAPIL